MRNRFEKDKYIWLPTDEDCYLPAKVVKAFDRGEEGVVASVGTKKEQQMNVTREASSRCFPMNEESLKMVPDMVVLQDLNEASILHNLRMRFKRDKIYTHIGKVLVSINPFKLTKLYTPDVLEDFKLHGHRDNLPHVYGVADDAYRALLNERKSQACLISGESGSGKTEATKLFLQYIAEMSGGMRSLKEIQRGEEAPLQEQILRATPLLEAFGNAKTLRNDNSSRFGKWINIQFNRKGTVVNASISNYLLEKTRIVRHSPGERNYHIFYQLIAGCKADSALKDRCKLGDIHDYNYLRATRPQHHARMASSAGNDDEENEESDEEEKKPIDDDATTNDEHDFEFVRTSMDVLNMTTKDKNEIFRTVAAILHVGNIRFSAVQQRNQEDSSKVSNIDVLDLVAKQLGLEVEALGKALVTRTIGGRSGSVIVINLKPSDAVQARDALAKAIYSYLFEWLTKWINRSLSRKTDTKPAAASVSAPSASSTGTSSHPLTAIKEDVMQRCSIGILDIYGFESLDTNSFEQLCINYCNEKLQNYFNDHIFRLEQARYAEEGIKVPTIDYINNDGCVTLLEGKPSGIFAMLDDEVNVAGGTDLNFLNKLLTSAPGYGCLEKPGPKVKNAHSCFLVIHYAGKVLYDTYMFLEKNKDVIPVDLVNLCRSSTIPFVAAIFDAGQSEGNAGDTAHSTSVTGFVRRASMRVTSAVTSAFKKPAPSAAQQNKKTLATQFRDQLNDLTNTLKSMEPHFIRCIKPNSRSQPDSFTSPMVLRQLKNLGILEVARIRKNGFPVFCDFKDFVFLFKPLHPSSATVQNLVNDLIKADIISAQGVAVGKSKVFLKYSEYEKLQSKRNDYLQTSVVKIQAIGRKFVQRKKYKGYLKLIDDIHHCLIARDEKDLDNLLTEAGELPNFGRHIDTVESARKLQKRFIEERRVMDLLEAAVSRHDLSSLMSGLATARRMKLSNPKADSIIEAAQKAVEKIQDMKQLRVELSTAIDSNDAKNLISAINHATTLEATGVEEYRHAQALLERLEGELSIEKELEHATKSRDLEKIAATLKKAAALGYDHIPLADKARAARSELRAEQKMIKLLNALVEYRSLPELKAIITKCELAKIPNEALKEARELKKTLEKEDSITRDVASAATKRDIRGLQIAISKAEAAGLGNAILVNEGKSLLKKTEGREKCEVQLANASKSKDPVASGVIVALINGSNYGITSSAVYSAAQAAFKKAAKSTSDIVGKICDAISAGDVDTLEVLLTRAKTSGIADSNLEEANEICKRMLEENKVVNELYEAMALGDLKRLSAGLDKANTFDDFASRNHIAYEKAKAVLRATRLAVVGLKSEDPGMIADALAAAKSAGAQEEGAIAECIKLQGSLQHEANVVRQLLAAFETANAHRLAAGPPGDISAQHDRDAVSIQIQNDIVSLRTLLERVPESMNELDIVVDVRNRVGRADNVEDTLSMLSDATEGNDLERLNDALVHVYQLGLFGREIEAAKKLRDKLGAQLDIINEMMADINIVRLRMTGKDGITENDIDVVDNAVTRAKSQGLPSNVKQLREAEKLAAKMKRQLVVQAELRAALATNDFTKLKLAMDHANEHEVETEVAQQVRAAVRAQDLAKRAAQKAAFDANTSQTNEEITEEQLVKEREAKLARAGNPKFHFSKYSKIRADEDFCRGVVFNKKKVITEKLTYQTSVIPRSILVMEKSSSKVAVKIYQDILGYCGDKSASQPAALAQDILEKVVENHDLSDEVYIQLFKHASKNTKLDSLTKTWQLLALIVGTFPPSAEFEYYVLNFFQSHSMNTNPINNYAKFCLRRVEGILNTGITGFIPSAQEILSYKDRPPILATIELCDGTQLTTDLPITPDLNVGKVRDICAHFLGIKDARIRDCFGVFVIDNAERRKLKAAIEAARAYDDPAAAARAANASNIAHSPRPLSDTDYLGNVVVLMNRLKHDYTFVYKRKLYSPDIEVVSDDSLFRKLVFMQAQEDFVYSNVRCDTEAETVTLASISVAASNDPFPATVDAMIDIDILSYIPKHVRYTKTDREWALLVINQSEKVIHDPQDYLQDKLVDVLKKSPMFGACFFHALRMTSDEPEVTSLPARIVCAINGRGLMILDEDTWAMLRHYPFSMINRWGGTARLFSFSISRHDDSTGTALAKEDGVKQPKKIGLSKSSKSSKKINAANGKPKASFELALQMAQAGDMSALLGDYVAYIMKRERNKITNAGSLVTSPQ